jgi:hypothetical protein
MPAPPVAFIAEPGVSNLVVQTYYPSSDVDHAELVYGNTTSELMMNAVDPAHPVAVSF